MREDAEYRHHDKIQKTAYLRVDQSSKSGQWEKEFPGKDSGNQWDEKGNTRDRGHVWPGHFTRAHSFIINKIWEGQGFLCTGVKEFRVYPATELVTGMVRWQLDFRGAGPLSRCATAAHTQYRENTGREMQEMGNPFRRFGVKSMGRDGPGSWLSLGTSAWLCGKDRWGGLVVWSRSARIVGLTAWCSGMGWEPKKNVRGAAI